MMNSLLKFKKLSAVIALTLASSSTLAADLGVANNYSAFVFEDFKGRSGQADNVVAAKNIDLKGKYLVASKQIPNPEKYYLISESNITFKNGQLFVGSIIAGGGVDIHKKVLTNMEQDSQVLSRQNESAMPFNFDEQEEYYKNLSAELSEIESTGSVTYMNDSLYLSGDDTAQVQVFKVDARKFAKAKTFKVKGIPNDATVIFNITGDEKVVVKHKSFVDLLDNATKTVFNFTNTQKLDIKGSRWEGVILAPYADIRGAHGSAKMPIIGQSFYGSMALLGSEFNGDLPSVAQPIAPFAMQQKWHWNSSDFMPEYNQVMATPVVAQLNDDNNDGVINNYDVADVVVVTFNKSYSTGIVRALNGIDGSELWDYSQGVIKADATYSPAAADFDGDGIVEIVVASRWYGDNGNGAISVIDINGAIKKQITKVDADNFKLVGNIDVADINNDGSLEFTLGNAIYNYDTGALFEFGTDWSPSSVIFDADNDGVQEVLARGKLYDANGVELWSYVGEKEVWFSSVANIDNDSQPEVILSIPAWNTVPEKSSFVALEANGNVKWEVNNLSNPGGGVQAISNFLGAKNIGIVYSGFTAIDMYNNDGQLVWSVPSSDSSGQVGVSAYDFNGDGIDEVIIQNHLSVRVLNGVNGEVLSSIPNSSATLWEYPIVVDLEGDDNAELITVSNNYDSRYSINNGVTVYGAADNNKPWKNATRIWNQHSYHQTNINQDGTVPIVELPSWLNNNTYRSSTLK